MSSCRDNLSAAPQEAVASMPREQVHSLSSDWDGRQARKSSCGSVSTGEDLSHLSSLVSLGSGRSWQCSPSEVSSSDSVQEPFGSSRNCQEARTSVRKRRPPLQQLPTAERGHQQRQNSRSHIADARASDEIHGQGPPKAAQTLFSPSTSNLDALRLRGVATLVAVRQEGPPPSPSSSPSMSLPEPSQQKANIGRTTSCTPAVQTMAEVRQRQQQWKHVSAHQQQRELKLIEKERNQPPHKSQQGQRQMHHMGPGQHQGQFQCQEQQQQQLT
ncbi:unnamed protein product [Polarella glacialis]|uniref:Uncharacterized protein n=1 Tax=Polarella glacialis TaxID=89957 RepID=A0A813HCS2_POLGL|nr:unnamed protein product [Polarella glacialis]